MVELSGMSAYCDFNEQVSVATESGRLQPDLVVRLPGGRSLVVDSKANTSAYLDAVEATDDQARERHLQKYVADVRNTFRALGSKEYWKRFDNTPEFVVMFIPGEAFFAAAISQDRNLLLDGIDKSVLMASPTTLAALLMAIRYGWQQQQVAENAEHIAKAGRDLYDRLCTFVSHLDAVRDGIEKTAQAYDKAVGSWEKRTLPSVRRLKDLGADSGTQMNELKQTTTSMRPLPQPDDTSA